MKYFIGSKDFSGKVEIAESVTDERLLPYIRSAQKSCIEPILGCALYQELQDQMSTNHLTDANKRLLPYIQEVHVYYAYQEFLLWAPVQLTEYGFVIKNAIESESIQPQDLGKYIKWAKQTGDTFCAGLRKFLYDNKADYPLWGECVCDYYTNNFNSGSNWINVGKNLTGKRSSVIAEEAFKKADFDFKTAYNFWITSLGFTS